MGHDTGRPAPAAITSDPTAEPTASQDPRWADIAADHAPSELDAVLACPSCGADLLGADDFETYRVCAQCDRHFPVPALERVHLLADADSFTETNGVLVSVDPLIFRDLLPFPDQDEQMRQRTGPGGGLGEAVITGTATIGGRPALLLVLDHTYLGGNLGPVAAEKVVLAMEHAAAHRLPLIAICAASYSGYPTVDESRSQAGVLSLAQWPKIAAAAARLHGAAVPLISVLAHPTTGGVYAGLGSQADVILAEPGAHISLDAAHRGYPAVPMATTAEDLLAQGQLDAVIDRRQVRTTIAALLGLFADRGGFVAPPAEDPVPVTVSPPHWEQLALSAHPERPDGREITHLLTSEFVALHGDRIGGDDPAITCGLGRVGGRPVAIVAQNRRQAEHEIATGVTGWRQALRVMRLAGRFELPIVALIDSAGRAAAPGPEDAGTGLAIAGLMHLSSLLPVPIVSVIIGQGRGLPAMALSSGDRRLMLQHSVLMADETHQPAQPPWSAEARSAFPAAVLPGAQPLTAQECLRLGLVDTVVAEPLPAAHADPATAARLLDLALSRALAELSGFGPRRLLEDRSRRVRSLGASTPEVREEARREIRELQELQRTLSRSLGGLRGRWEGRARGRPRLPRPSLPSVASLPRPGSLDPGRLGTRVRPELADLAGRIADGVRSRGHHGGHHDHDAPLLDDDRPPPPSRPDSLN